MMNSFTKVGLAFILGLCKTHAVVVDGKQPENLRHNPSDIFSDVTEGFLSPVVDPEDLWRSSPDMGLGRSRSSSRSMEISRSRSSSPSYYNVMRGASSSPSDTSESGSAGLHADLLSLLPVQIANKPRKLLVEFGENKIRDHDLDEWKVIEGVYTETGPETKVFQNHEKQYEICFMEVTCPFKEETTSSWVFRPILELAKQYAETPMQNDQQIPFSLGELSGCAWLSSQENWDDAGESPWVAPLANQKNDLSYLLGRDHFAGFIGQHSTKKGLKKYLKLLGKHYQESFLEAHPNCKEKGLKLMIAKTAYASQMQRKHRNTPENDHIHHATFKITEMK